MLKLEYFIDSHCHLFNISDVPILQTLLDKEKLVIKNVRHPLKALLLPSLTFKRKFIKQQLYKFISFFESEISTNISNIDSGLQEIFNDGQFNMTAENKIITPLIMDFDKNGFVCNDNPEKLANQIARLTSSISNTDISTKILPFIGLDPRRFIYDNWSDNEEQVLSENAIRTKIETFLNNYKVNTSKLNPLQIQTGTICGFKLYPSLGWDLIPANADVLNAYVVVLQALSDLDIPITVHCQKASFELGMDSKKGNSYTNPEKWNQLFLNCDFKSMRLNLAHFGGEEGVERIADFESINEFTYEYKVGGPKKKGWTFEIIKMLKKYDNTYADISAFDWDNDHAVASLLWVLYWDSKDGVFDESISPNHKIIDKLLWGTDIPMVLDAYAGYYDYFSSFYKAINYPEELVGEKYPIPPQQDRHSVEEIISKIAFKNPMKYHFGIVC